MPDDQAERTEPASPKRKEEAQRKGQVAKSRELSSALIFLGAMVTFYLTGSSMWEQIRMSWQRSFSQAGQSELSLDGFQSIFLLMAVDLFHLVGPFLILLPLMAIGSHLAQGGPVWATEALSFNPSRINPMKGFQKLFSGQAFLELGKSIFKITLVSWAIYWALKEDIWSVVGLVELDPEQIGTFLVQQSYRLGWVVFWPLLGLAALDYGLQLWFHEKSLRMTRQEVKEEIREREGDPQIRARIKAIQREMAQKRMMDAVPRAQVVITNPTELAIALAYQSGKMSAPQVVAKGAGYIAGRIREVARENGVPIIENKPLAQALYQGTEVGQLIPAQLYQAVAEVLAYVYSLQGIRGQKAEG